MRIASMCTTVHRIRPRFLKLPDVEQQAKLGVIKALVLTRGLFHAGTWPCLKVSEHDRITNAIGKVYRDSFFPFVETMKPVSYHDALATLRVPLPAAMIAQARVNLLIRLIQRASTTLLCLLTAAASAERSWVCAAQRDLDVLVTHTTAFEGKRLGCLADWVADAQQSPRALRRSIATAFANLAVGRHCCPPKAGSRAPAHDLEGRPVTYPCTDCAREFASPQALASHAAAKHKFMHPVRQRLSTPTCPACLKFFHDRLRLTAHVMRGNANCRQYVLNHMDPLEPSL